MKSYKFKIGKNELEMIAPSYEAAYFNAQEYANYYGWKGKIILLESK